MCPPSQCIVVAPCVRTSRSLVSLSLESFLPSLCVCLVLSLESFLSSLCVSVCVQERDGCSSIGGSRMQSSAFILAPSHLSQQPVISVRTTATPTPSLGSTSDLDREGRNTPMAPSDSSSSLSSAGARSHPFLLYCSYAWVQNMLCASLMDSSGQQLHTITLHSAARYVLACSVLLPVLCCASGLKFELNPTISAFWGLTASIAYVVSMFPSLFCS